VNAGIAGQTALSGSQIKPPALPEVHDSPISHGRFVYNYAMLSLYFMFYRIGGKEADKGAGVKSQKTV
jgi:hypothetical protein